MRKPVAGAVMAVTIVASFSLHAEAQAHSAAAAALLVPDSRVRAFDREARHILESAVGCSPTVASMVVQLRDTDLIVVVETASLKEKTAGELRVVAATADTRYVRIRIRTPNAANALVSVLGHELEHALEVASARDVRDAASLRRLYMRIGYPTMQDGYFETDEALEAGRRAAREVANCRAGE